MVRRKITWLLNLKNQPERVMYLSRNFIRPYMAIRLRCIIFWPDMVCSTPTGSCSLPTGIRGPALRRILIVRENRYLALTTEAVVLVFFLSWPGYFQRMISLLASILSCLMVKIMDAYLTSITISWVHVTGAIIRRFRGTAQDSVFCSIWWAVKMPFSTKRVIPCGMLQIL